MSFLEIFKRKKHILNSESNDYTHCMEIANELNLDFSEYNLEKVNTSLNNSFIVDDCIYFYPPNDGRPTMPIYFFKDGKIILKNDKAFSEIDNLDDILIKMTEIFNKALDKNIILNPYGFMLRLTDDYEENYKGEASLVLTDKSIISKNDNEAKKYFINRYLDHFIGWNFGVSVNRSDDLKVALEKLNNKVIDLGLREDAGPGFEVYGLDYEVYNGLQHYTLPKSRNNAPQKVYK